MPAGLWQIGTNVSTSRSERGKDGVEDGENLVPGLSEGALLNVCCDVYSVDSFC